ncbi:ABC transporter permease [Actinoplanes sp. TFC3]|uniref:ABC transporter permease n=1 Tax=Actinoplanes sp. TFC3 TaxID=1710355 RepID=UPI000829E66A|nr:ABC transporter permease [Actinoplanes sp. TFC3]
MSLLIRRAGAARSLLAAAGALALIATLLLTGLVAYSREVVRAGAASTLAASAPPERAVLVRGSAGRDPADLDRRDAAVRQRFAAGLGGRDVAVSAAGYATGRAFSGPTGDAVPDSGGVVYASVMFLGDLSAHAVLTDGAWPEPGAQQPQTAVGAGVARALGLAVGDRVPVVNRINQKVTTLRVSGIWRPHEAADPYFQLAPDVVAGVAPSSATYGPLVVDRADFARSFAGNASAAWLAAVDLSGAGVTQVRRAADAAAAERAELPAKSGLGTSAVVDTGLSGLIDRLERADLVGRSALVTPVLLVAVLSGLALVLIAALLTEHRRAESALLRARGATSRQLAGLTAAEALAVVAPAGLIAAPLAAAAVHLAGQRRWFGLTEPSGWQPGPLLWIVAALAAIGCAAAITVPVLRGGTYVEDLQARSRPNRRAALQRAGADVLLIALAVLGWLQLRRYASPLSGGPSGGLGIDPLLAAAPTLAILAGATLALRLLAPAARLTERRLTGGQRFAPLFGMWQAGRRPHAGPVLLLALAVAASTVGWCLAGTASRSVSDQADHGVGADLRLTEISGAAPAGRAQRLAALSGVTDVRRGWRESVQASIGESAADLIAIDGIAAGGSVQIRSDLYGGGAKALSTVLTGARPDVSLDALPAGTRLTGRAEVIGSMGVPTITAIVVDSTGEAIRIPLSPGRFTAALPGDGTGLRLAGFVADADASYVATTIELRLSQLAIDGKALPLGDKWALMSVGQQPDSVVVSGAAIGATVPAGGLGRAKVTIVRPVKVPPVPIVATPGAQQRLHLSGDRPVTMRIGGADVPVRLAGSIVAVPGSDDPAAVLADLPTLQAYLLYQAGIVHETQEWWLSVPASTHTQAAMQALRLGGLQVNDRREQAAASAVDSYGVGGRTALFAAAIGALLLAAAGVLVDVRTTTRRRISELAVLHTLGAGPRLLARSLMTEQAFLAGTGVLAGLAVGIGVAAAMAPLMILTPQASRPVPPPYLVVDWVRAGGTALLLFVLAAGLSALAGITLRRRLAAARLYLGADR